ncbi:DUF2256 domain-containing protein [Pseudomarimonas salicorniae]|uniref:DUF2256 domain-containing protein n=1 Tax=Pseudomarimonas salicorniae TaxID=2933270 RepID=A0ABT0GKD1_9GAMM|nr:DUF2256 domain-containing protein [Lysobacter sp. CAU 1642]MCK7594507.1 DUF2256 domain-containing protein [Lysobacter sp. CAU 1642]
MPGSRRESRAPGLPEKRCPVCQRMFSWRRKWAKDWDQVVYCSDACRRGTPRGAAAQPGITRKK